MKRVYRWPVPVDDHMHAIGAGHVVHVGTKDHVTVDVWTEEPVTAEQSIPGRAVRVFGTGHDVPDEATHLGTAIAQPYVWHVYEVEP